MLIKETNKNRINEAIKAAEGRARERLITYDDMEKAIAKLETKLGIAKKSMEGVKVRIDVNAQDFPRAYKYRAESTHFEIVRKASGWDLIAVYRDYCRRETQAFEVTLTDTAKKAIIESKERFGF